MTKKRILGSILILIVLFISSLSYLAYCWSYTDVDDYRGTSVNFDSVLHSSGKYILATKNSSTTMRIHIFNPSGELESTVEYVDASGHDLRSYTVFEIDDDEIGIFQLRQWISTTYRFDAVVIRININSYTQNVYTLAQFHTYSTPLDYIRRYAGIVCEYGDIFYWLPVTGKMRTGTSYEINLHVIDYDPSDNSMSESAIAITGENDRHAGYVYGFQYEDDPENAYVMIQKNDPDAISIDYYEVDLDSASGTLLASHPQTDNIEGGNLVQYLGGDIVEYGDLFYMYHTWCYPRLSGSLRFYRFYQHRVVFENIIHPDNISSSSKLSTSITPNFGIESELSWIIGAMEDKETFILWYADKHAGEITDDRIDMHISDWYNEVSPTLVIDSIENDVEEVPFIDDDDEISRIQTSKFQANRDVTPSDDDTRVYYDLTPLYADYEATLSYTPTDDPLETDKSYRFTVTTTMNGFAEKTTILGYIDGTNYINSDTDLYGELEFTFVTSVSGFHNFTMKVYDGSPKTLKTTVSEEYFFTTEEDAPPETPDVLPSAISFTVKLIPMLLMIVVPTYALQEIFQHLFGGLVGLNIGIIVCILSGLLPSSLLYIMLILDIIGLIFIARSG